MYFPSAVSSLGYSVDLVWNVVLGSSRVSIKSRWHLYISQQMLRIIENSDTEIKCHWVFLQHFQEAQFYITLVMILSGDWVESYL